MIMVVGKDGRTYRLTYMGMSKEDKLSRVHYIEVV